MENNEINVRYNMASLVGYWSAMSKILCQRMEFMLENETAYGLHSLSKDQVIRICEDLKEVRRVSDYVWENRMSEDFDSKTIIRTREILSKIYTKNNDGRTISLDQEQKG